MARAGAGLVTVILIVFASALPAPSVMAARNRLHLRGEDDFTDSSGNEYHGNPVGGDVEFRPGVADRRAFRFGPNAGHIAIEHGGNIDLRSSFTLAFWIKPEHVPVNGVVFAEGLVDRQPSGRAVYIDAERRDGDGLVTYVDTGIGTLRSRTPINDGGWHHVAIVIDYDAIVERAPIGIPPHLETHRIVRGIGRIYIDGLPDADNGRTRGFDLFRLRQGLTDRVTVGGTEARFPDLNLANPEDERNAFRGFLDDLQIFEGALTEQQVFEISEAESKDPISCPDDDTQAISIAVDRIDEFEGSPLPANSFRATAKAQDGDGSTLLYTFTLEQLDGAVVRHMTPKEIGPKADQSKSFVVAIGTPPVDVERRVERPGSVAIFRNVPAGRWRIVVEVTDGDNLLCKDNLPGTAGTEDNILASDEFVVYPLPDFIYAVSSFGGGNQLWYQAEDIDVADGLFELGDPGGWKIVDHPAAFGGQVITRVAGVSQASQLFACGEGGGRTVREFDIGLAGLEGGLHFFWGRAVNAFNSSEFASVPGDPDDLDMPTEPAADGGWPGFGRGDDGGLTTPSDRIFDEDGNWSFVWQKLDLIVRPEREDEGHDKVLRDGLNEHHIYHRQGCAAILTDVHCWTNDALYLPTDQDLLAATILQPFVRGDCNSDARIDLSDGISLLNFAFLGVDEPSCQEACDFDAQGELGITTAVFFFNALFQGGAAIPPPQDCGFALPIVGCQTSACES